MKRKILEPPDGSLSYDILDIAKMSEFLSESDEEDDEDVY